MVDVFIDESGNQGAQGKYFVIAAIVCSESHSKYRIKRIFKKSCLKFSRTSTPLPEIKSSSLDFMQHQELLNKISLRTDHEIFILAIDKKQFKSNLDNNLQYSYLSGVLIKQILKKYNSDIRITFDQRDVKATSLTSIADYLKIKADIDWGFKHNLEVLRKDSRTVYCLQAADLIAYTAYNRYSSKREHLLKVLSPRIEKLIEFPIGKFTK